MGKGKRKRINRAAVERLNRQNPSHSKTDFVNNGSGIMMKDSGYKYHLIALLSICAICAVIYSDTLHGPFVFDDKANITKNPYIRLTGFDIKPMWDAAFKSNYRTRPVSNISFAMNYYFGRYDVLGYHLVNILIHFINGILVYFIALTIFSRVTASHTGSRDESTITKTYLMSIFSALLFVVHPLQVESVTYIVQRTTSMSTMFFLLALFLYIKGRLSLIRSRQLILFSGCVLSWLLALGSKQIAITLPFIVLLYEWYFFQDLSTVWLRKNVKFLLILAAMACLFAFIYQGGNPIERILAGYERRDFTLWERVLTQPRVIIFYISLLLYPHPSRLNLDHHFATSHSLVDPVTTILSLLTLLGLLGLAWILARRNRLISFGSLWFFINLALESSVIGLEMIFEHRLYLPLVGPAVIVAYLVFQLPSNKQLWAPIISGAIICSLGAATYQRNRVWKDEVTLWRDCVKKSPQKARTRAALGASLLRQNKIAEAIVQLSESLRIDPGIFDGHNNLGAALLKQGKYREAEVYCSKALQLIPENPQAHDNLGAALLMQGRIEEAKSHFSEALRISPESYMPHYNMGIVHARQGRNSEALLEFSEALRINPDFADAHYNLGAVLLRQDRIGEAISHFSEALRIKPGYVLAAKSLRTALAIQDRSIQEKADKSAEVNFHPVLEMEKN